LENGTHATAIDTLTNKVIANIPVGQTTQALVYVPGAVTSGAGADNLVPLGEAGNTEHIRLEAAGTGLPAAEASAAVNSLGLLDLVEIAARGLASGAQYRVYLAQSNVPPFGNLEPLAIFKTNPDGAGIVQALGPLKALVRSGAATDGTLPQRFLIITELNDPSRVVLRQVGSSKGFQ
jgi:hypothetical protein